MKNRYFYLMTVGTVLTECIIYSPGLICASLFEGGLIAIPIGFLISSLIYYGNMNVMNKYKDKDLCDINNILLGKYWGNITNLTFIALNYSIGFFMFRGIIEISRKFMLPTSSFWITGGILAVIPFFAYLNKRENILYLLSYFTVIIIFGTTMYVLVATKNFEWYWIEGTIRHEIVNAKIPTISLISVATYYFSGFDNLSYFNPKFKKYNIKKVITIVGIFGFISAFITVFLPTLIWGSSSVKSIEHPWITSSDTIGIDMFFMERGMFIVIPLFLLYAVYQIIRLTYNAGGIFMKTMENKKEVYYIKVGIILIYIPITYLLKDFDKAIYIFIRLKIVYLIFSLILIFILNILAKDKERVKI